MGSPVKKTYAVELSSKRDTFAVGGSSLKRSFANSGSPSKGSYVAYGSSFHGVAESKEAPRAPTSVQSSIKTAYFDPSFYDAKDKIIDPSLTSMKLSDSPQRGRRQKLLTFREGERVSDKGDGGGDDNDDGGNDDGGDGESDDGGDQNIDGNDGIGLEISTLSPKSSRLDSPPPYFSVHEAGISKDDLDVDGGNSGDVRGDVFGMSPLSDDEDETDDDRGGDKAGVGDEEYQGSDDGKNSVQVGSDSQGTEVAEQPVEEINDQQDYPLSGLLETSSDVANLTSDVESSEARVENIGDGRNMAANDGDDNKTRSGSQGNDNKNMVKSRHLAKSANTVDLMEGSSSHGRKVVHWTKVGMDRSVVHHNEPTLILKVSVGATLFMNW